MTRQIVARHDWLTARKELLAKEEEAARMWAAVAEQRRQLPAVKIEKEYVFDGPTGTATLLDLFDGRRQLITYHFMFDPAWDEGCKHCSFLADNIGHLSHLHSRDTTLVLVSRAPATKIAAFRERMGWSVPWYSSYGSSFNYDFHVTLDESVAPVTYNFKDKATLEADGEVWFTQGEQGGVSVFLRDGDTVLHTYSAYAHSTDLLHGTYNYLDLTALGRQDAPGRPWLRHHDRYDGNGAA
ncbi:DUF899 domain-containing protein [Solwaraspora sp. WMMA2056]|uniref:DUF899 domain-containing protein n=1 Tax=Solwaraspora sp. WMMA2056 TaxID=3015161 RepID=UPI00259B6E87|nr:DUF899 domain-containing protein [Solwaraspora sp. WMMA2056]WJK38634.1 DUF899 domain-containing protein [Solwaraspora sp. WMMA2056]